MVVLHWPIMSDADSDSSSEVEIPLVWAYTSYRDHKINRMGSELVSCPLDHTGACIPMELRLQDGTMNMCGRLIPGSEPGRVISCTYLSIQDWMPFINYTFGTGHPAHWNHICRWYAAYQHQGLRYLDAHFMDAYATYCEQWADEHWQRWREGGPITSESPDILGFWVFIPLTAPHGWTDRTNDHHVAMITTAPHLYTATPTALATYTHDPRRLRTLLQAWVTSRQGRGCSIHELAYIRVTLECVRSPPPLYTCDDVEAFIRTFPQCVNLHYLLHNRYCDGSHPDPAPQPPAATPGLPSPNRLLLSPSSLLGLVPDPATPLIAPMTPAAPGRRNSTDEPPAKHPRIARRLDFETPEHKDE